MDRMTAFCGLSCAECQAHLATVNNDDALRAKTAEMWSKMYQTEIKAEQINCDGCQRAALRPLSSMRDPFLRHGEGCGKLRPL